MFDEHEDEYLDFAPAKHAVREAFAFCTVARPGVRDYWLGYLVLGLARDGGVGMSEHLTQPERIAKLEVELGDAEDRIERLRARAAKLEAALTEDTRQRS